MDYSEISAVAAYANKHLKKKLGLSTKPQSFLIKKKKKKKKLKENNLNTTKNTNSKVEDLNYDLNSEKQVEKNFIPSLEKPKKKDVKSSEPFFKMEKVFLNNEFKVVLGSEKKNANGNQKEKKKKKTVSDEALDKFENVMNNGEVEIKRKKLKLDKWPEKNSGEILNIKNSKSLSAIYSNSMKLGEEVFSWILSPVPLKDFFKNFWEQKPLLIKHKNKNYFESLCTLDDFKKSLEVNDVYFTKNIDVTSYIDGKRQTENPEGLAKPFKVWSLFNKGRSIRMLNPQTFIPNIRILNTFLQEFFQCFVGANIYLTPAGTQGFAPHYDDIEAFVLQLEGEKHWKLYNPRNPDEILPRESSKNFEESEIGEPILEVTLRPGDVLYFPRGFIHQAKCLPHVHSLHVTVSCYQKNSWADFMEKVIPVALQTAINEDVEFRKGLPLGFLNHVGLVHSDEDSSCKREFLKKFEELAQKLIEYCPVNAGADQIGADFMQDALPPYLSKEEKLYGANEDVKLTEKFEEMALDKTVGVKLVRANAVRLVSEENETVLYYTTSNSLVYHEHEAFSASVSPQWAEAIEHLIKCYPDFTPLKRFLGTKIFNEPWKWKRVVEFIYFLWEKGLVLFNKPLQQIFS